MNQTSYEDASKYIYYLSFDDHAQYGVNLRVFVACTFHINPKRYIQMGLAIDQQQQKGQEKRMTASVGGLASRPQTGRRKRKSSIRFSVSEQKNEDKTLSNQ